MQTSPPCPQGARDWVESKINCKHTTSMGCISLEDSNQKTKMDEAFSIHEAGSSGSLHLSQLCWVPCWAFLPVLRAPTAEMRWGREQQRMYPVIVWMKRERSCCWNNRLWKLHKPECNVAFSFEWDRFLWRHGKTSKTGMGGNPLQSSTRSRGIII